LRAREQEIGAREDPAEPRLLAEQFEDAGIEAKQGHEAKKLGGREEAGS
jgi:hypothetical protein